MNPSNHLSLPLSKQLSHLFSEIDLHWVNAYKKNHEFYETGWLIEHKRILSDGFIREHYPASQLHDVLEVLPDLKDLRNKYGRVVMRRFLSRKRWSACYERMVLYFIDPLPVEAAGKLAVWCVENKHLPKGTF